ncbi:MAG: putative transposase [Flavobacteriales bacterium]|jgi:putative transposase
MVGKRNTIRLSGYNYKADGYYFFTCVTKNRIPLFGSIANQKMNLSLAGKWVHEEWVQTGQSRNNIRLDEFIVMPDHVHGIIVLGEPVIPLSGSPWPALDEENTSKFGDSSNTLGAIIGGFKAACSRRVRRDFPEFGWTRNYWERIIRSHEELNAFRSYIKNNPIKG